MPDQPAQQPPNGEPDPQSEPQSCDFCGKPSSTVRRVALDRDYDRLRKPHREQYACPECSEAKERQRRGLDRG
jgi:ribosomal protein L37AE/L43A